MLEDVMFNVSILKNEMIKLFLTGLFSISHLVLLQIGCVKSFEKRNLELRCSEISMC